MLRAQDYRCHYCGKRGDYKTERLHKEHDVPLSRGGPHHIDNIRPSCARCNLVKGMLTGAEFKALIADNGGTVPTSRAKRVEPQSRQPTQRAQVIDAMARLTEMRGDLGDFSVDQIIGEIRSKGSLAPEASLRVTISTLGTAGTLERVGRGIYRLPRIEPPNSRVSGSGTTDAAI